MAVFRDRPYVHTVKSFLSLRGTQGYGMKHGGGHSAGENPWQCLALKLRRVRRSPDTMHADTGTDGIIFADLLA